MKYFYKLTTHKATVYIATLHKVVEMLNESKLSDVTVAELQIDFDFVKEIQYRRGETVLFLTRLEFGKDYKL